MLPSPPPFPHSNPIFLLLKPANEKTSYNFPPNCCFLFPTRRTSATHPSLFCPPPPSRKACEPSRFPIVSNYDDHLPNSEAGKRKKQATFLTTRLSLDVKRSILEGLPPASPRPFLDILSPLAQVFFTEAFLFYALCSSGRKEVHQCLSWDLVSVTYPSPSPPPPPPPPPPSPPSPRE